MTVDQNKEPQKVDNKPDEWMTGADTQGHISEMVGALWTYIFRRKSRSLAEIGSKENASTNRLIGWCITMIIILLGVIILVLFLES